jgi:hypothetical protein
LSTSQGREAGPAAEIPIVKLVPDGYSYDTLVARIQPEGRSFKNEKNQLEADQVTRK